MEPAEYPTFLERSKREYVEEVAANTGMSEQSAQAKADGQYEELLPDGLATPDQHLFVIVDGDDEVVGELWIGLRDEGREAFGYDFWVRPELRDQGIGRRTMELGAEAARELGAERLALNVFGDNERAVHLYRSFGFEVTNMNMAKRL
jgi:ribosomal protein S18 acetylase RimI-like enzyme